MTRFTFSLPTGLVARVQSDASLYTAREELLLQAYVPGIVRASAAKRSDIHLSYRVADHAMLRSKGLALHLQDPSKSIPDDLYHLFYSAARNALLKKGVYCAHTACVDLNGLVLIAGHSGSGKTTLALELLMNHGSKIFSGNKTAISFTDGMQTIAGTRTITVNTADLQKYGPLDHVLYGTRAAFALPAERYAPAGPIKALYFVKLNDGNDELQELNPLRALHTAYPFFLDAVNADTIVAGEYLFEGTATQKVKNTLVKHLVATLPNIRTYAITGSRDFIARTMVQHEK